MSGYAVSPVLPACHDPAARAGRRVQRSMRKLLFSRLCLFCVLASSAPPLVRAQATSVAVESFPGADLSARLAAGDAALGQRAGTLSVNVPGTIRRALTLHRGHSLLLRAPVTWSETVSLEGENSISCEGGAARVTAGTPAFHFPAPGGTLLLASGASGITVRGCSFVSDQTSMLLVGAPVARLTMENNTLAGLSLAVTWNGSSNDLRFTGNTVVFPVARHSDIAAISLYGAKQVVANGNHFTRTLHGIQWWGGDSGAPGATLDQVTSTGEMQMVGNTCAEVGSCVWGSMGYGIKISGNTAAGCGDVCFDTEGGRDTEISGNTASGCANGCAAIFFFTRNTAILGNHFSGMPGGGFIFIKNASADPLRHQGVLVSGNTMECLPGPCRAMYAEAASAVRFENNQIVNGTYLPVNYARAVTIAGNHMRFTVPLPAGTPAIQAPAILGGTTLLVSNNTIESDVAQAPGTACIAASWSDFNNTDLHILAGNRCGGSHPFPVGIVTTTDGKNPGPHALWYLAGNTAFGQATLHHAATANDVYRELASCGPGQCRTATVSTPRGAICAGGNFGQLQPADRGSAAAICANGDNGQFVWIPVPGSR